MIKNIIERFRLALYHYSHYNPHFRRTGKMASVFDTADYILSIKKEATAWQLQKWCYYSKAWGLAINGRALFPENFEAWENGPVCYELYAHHKGWKNITRARFSKGNANNLSDSEKALIRAILYKYDYSGEELRKMTHEEGPWLDSRGTLPLNVRSRTVISDKSMADYYGYRQDELDEINDYALSLVKGKDNSFFRQPANLPVSDNKRYFRIYKGKKTISINRSTINDYEAYWCPVHSYILEHAISCEGGSMDMDEEELSYLAEKGLKYEIYFATHPAEDAWEAVKAGIIA